MVALHPPLSGFPLSFVALLVAIETLQWTRLATKVRSIRGILIVAVVLSTAASFFSGYQAVSDLGEIPEATESFISAHHVIGRLLFFNVIALATSYWIAGAATHGKRFFYASYYVFLLVQVVLTVWAGCLGGALVFEHGVGVKEWRT
jgi:uncharacterized membrane protein